MKEAGNRCRKSGKVMMTRNAAKRLKRDALELKYSYKCPDCGRFHVASERKGR